MPGRPNHRGPDPEDEAQFAPKWWPALREATRDLSWLLDHGYAPASALELVGNRHSLTRRQRLAVSRCACTEEACRRRQSRRIEPSTARGEELWVDGFNVLIAVEAAMAGGVILRGRDDCYRDLAGVHARYRPVDETAPALELIGTTLAEQGVPRCCWWLDRPVSNSGRFRQTLLDTAARAGWDWKVELAFSPDHALIETDRLIATSDSAILDRCGRWLNLVRLVIDQSLPHVRLVDLRPEAGAPPQG